MLSTPAAAFLPPSAIHPQLRPKQTSREDHPDRSLAQWRAFGQPQAVSTTTCRDRGSQEVASPKASIFRSSSTGHPLSVPRLAATLGRHSFLATGRGPTIDMTHTILSHTIQPSTNSSQSRPNCLMAVRSVPIFRSLGPQSGMTLDLSAAGLYHLRWEPPDRLGSSWHPRRRSLATTSWYLTGGPLDPQTKWEILWDPCPGRQEVFSPNPRRSPPLHPKRHAHGPALLLWCPLR